MSDSSYYSQHRASADRHHHSGGGRYSRERDYYDSHHHSHRDDSYRRERRVPGHVTDPTRNSDAEIRRGQQEAMERYKTDSYYKPETQRSAKTKDTMSSPPPYNITSTQPPYYVRTNQKTSGYYSSSSSRGGRRRLPLNPSFLAAFTGLVGFGVLIAAIVIVDWLVTVTTENGTATTSRVTHTGLFQFCIYENKVLDSCSSVESLSGIGAALGELEQATRGLVIIAAIFGLAGVVVGIIYGLHKFERAKGAYYSGAIYLFAGCCGVAAMGCYSSVLDTKISETINGSVVIPGLSFFLGWFGTSLFLIAAVTCFFSNATTWSKK